MEDVNNIAEGGKVDKTAQATAATNTVNNSIESWADNNSTDRSYD